MVPMHALKKERRLPMNLNQTSANRLSLPAPPSRRSGALARREGGRNEWGESRREGPPSKIKTSSPRPSPPSYVGRRGRGRRRPVQGFNARILFRGILTPALSRPPSLRYGATTPSR